MFYTDEMQFDFMSFKLDSHCNKIIINFNQVSDWIVSRIDRSRLKGMNVQIIISFEFTLLTILANGQFIQEADKQSKIFSLTNSIFC